MYRATRLGEARTSSREAVEEPTAADMSGLLPHAAALGLGRTSRRVMTTARRQ